MNIGKVFKLVQFNLLTHGGVAVTPDQLGLKPEDVGQASGLSFDQVLRQQGIPGTAGAQQAFPKPPTPPADPADTEAQAKFNQEMVAYNQRLFAMNQQLLRLVMAQFQRFQSASPSATGTIPSFDTGVIGTGGILGGDTEL